MPYTIDGSAGTVPQEVLDHYKSRAGTWAGGGQNAFTDSQGFSWIPIGEDSGIWRGADAFGNALPISGFRRAQQAGSEASKIGESDHYFKPDGAYSHTSFNEKVESGAMQLAQLAAAVGGIGFLGAAAGVPMGFGGAAGAGAGAGAVGSGAGFVGEGALSGVAGWDAALAGAPSWSAAGGMTAGAGAANGSWDVAGSLGGSTGGVTPPNPFAAGGGGGSSGFDWRSILKGVGGGGSGGGGGFDWTSLIEPAIGLASSAYGANQAGKAAESQAAAGREAMAMFKPWMDNGAWAIGQGANMLGKSGPEAAKNAFLQDPGYQFRVDEGQRALERSAAARGGLASGKAIKDTIRFGQGMGSQEFGNSFNRLMSVAGMGQTATGQGADYRTQIGNAEAAGRVGSANAITNGISQGLSMYGNNRLMEQLLARG